MAHAVELTVSRESFAQAHRHTMAAQRQNRTLGSLLGRARRAESAAGARLARLLARAQLRVQRTQAQSAAEIATLLSRLAGHGLARDKLKAVDRALLDAQSRNWLRALSRS
jgi:hypothetical protein